MSKYKVGDNLYYYTQEVVVQQIVEYYGEDYYLAIYVDNPNAKCYVTEDILTTSPREEPEHESLEDF